MWDGQWYQTVDCEDKKTKQKTKQSHSHDLNTKTDRTYSHQIQSLDLWVLLVQSLERTRRQVSYSTWPVEKLVTWLRCEGRKSNRSKSKNAFKSQQTWNARVSKRIQKKSKRWNTESSKQTWEADGGGRTDWLNIWHSTQPDMESFLFLTLQKKKGKQKEWQDVIGQRVRVWKSQVRCWQWWGKVGEQARTGGGWGQVLTNG